MAYRARYFSFLGVQTIGAAIIFGYAVPLYREVLADPGAHEPRPETLVWSFAAIALMQTGYWIGYRFRPQMPQLRNAFVGHIILFAARMSFVLATSSFAFVVITRKPVLQIPAFRYIVFVAGLFALFCYTQELKRLGMTLIGSKQRPEDIG